MEIGSASRAKIGESACGDDYLVAAAGARTLVAVIDGLGHGPEAAAAAKTARSYLERTWRGTAPVPDLLRGLDMELRGTRGAAATVLVFDEAARSVSHAGVGNVEVVALSREPIRPLLSPGVLGARVRKLQNASFPWSPGDLLVVFTDGISSRLDLEPLAGAPVADIAKELLARFGKSHDDATCVVCRFAAPGTPSTAGI